jgi:hypothetical protein
MATFTAAKTSRGFVARSGMPSELSGQEGQILSSKIIEVRRSIQETESIKRLLQSLEETSKKREEELKYYLDSLHSEAASSNEAEFTVFVIDYSWQVWQALSSRFLECDLCLEVPDACPGHSDNLMYTWSKSEHYLECEIFGNRAVEFFYRNRKSGEVWGEDTTLEHGFSTAILEKATCFVW